MDAAGVAREGPLYVKNLAGLCERSLPLTRAGRVGGRGRKAGVVEP
jgi:hypothetical protein